MEARLEDQEVPADCKMEISEDGPAAEVYTIDTDDSASECSDDDDDEVIPVPLRQKLQQRSNAATSSQGRVPSVISDHAFHARSDPAKIPDVIDLTAEDDNEDEIMIAEPPGSSGNHVDADDMPELIEVDPVPSREVGEDRKGKGNEHFKAGEYYQALEMYSKAIEAMPTDAAYYGNRSACYMMLKRYKEALADVRQALQLEPKYAKGYLRLIRTTLALGNVRECEIAFENVAKMNLDVGADPERERLIWLKKHCEDIEATKLKKDYRKLVFLTSQALDVATADNSMKMVKADALVRLGRHTEAQELCTEVLQNDVRCAEALYIRAMCLYLDDNLEKSIQFVRQGLQYAPDNNSFQTLYKKLKQIKECREAGSVKFTAHRYPEAKEDYSKCLAIVSNGDMINITIQSKLYFNLALIAQKQNKLDDSLQACTKAIALNSNYLKAIIHRARLYSTKEQYDDAVHDLEAALRIDPTLRDLKRELNNAKLAAKRAKRKDYYKILNVDKNATEDEIRKAYKKRALVHHPDRHASATEAVQKEQEKLFKDLGEAYEVLSDQKKRFRYDQGVDLVEERGYEPSYDPSSQDFLNVFFGNQGYPAFRPGQAGARSGHHGFNHFHRN
ncbi:unnamed protein product [Orchesella dallaii]|uniref:J domain-containing protein n=1 Tax=Orchesella dallaii TaxID=48710 RepID=A0ABP1Q3T0_9HEXA